MKFKFIKDYLEINEKNMENKVWKMDMNKVISGELDTVNCTNMIQ